jgi:transcriptional regulator with XRE-family HTH domain
MAAHTPGERIVELRKTYSISRETLAERSDLPITLIQNIEEKGHIPDLAPLIKISRALGVRLGTLLDDHEETGPVITRAGTAGTATRFITGLPEGRGRGDAADADTRTQDHQGLHFNALAADKGGRHMEPFTVDIEPDAEQPQSAHEGEEFIHILSGTLSLEYGTAVHILNAGDSVYYDSIVPHRVFSANGEPVRILAVIYTPA